jgi:Peptidase S24-like.
MDTINNIVKTFISLRVVKSFFHLMLVIYLVNYIINHFVLWYFNTLWLLYISWLIFGTAFFVVKKLLKYLKLYNIYFLSLLWLLINIKTFFFDIKQIRGRSMEPTLKEGSWVLVDKGIL